MLELGYPNINLIEDSKPPDEIYMFKLNNGLNCPLYCEIN